MTDVQDHRPLLVRVVDIVDLRPRFSMAANSAAWLTFGGITNVMTNSFSKLSVMDGPFIVAAASAVMIPVAKPVFHYLAEVVRREFGGPR